MSLEPSSTDYISYVCNVYRKYVTDLNRRIRLLFRIIRHSTMTCGVRIVTRIITRNRVDFERVRTFVHRTVCMTSRLVVTRRCLCSIRFCANRSGISINPQLTDVHKSHSIRVCVQHAPSIRHPAADDWQRWRNRIVRLVLLNDSRPTNG